MVELASEEEHFYATSPTTVIYDIFFETATRLSGTYVDLSRRVATDAERERWWEKVLELKRFRRSVDPDDREALVSHIKQWRIEVNRLRDRELCHHVSDAQLKDAFQLRFRRTESRADVCAVDACRARGDDPPAMISVVTSPNAPRT